MNPVLITKLNNAFTLFLSLLVEAIPFLILGVLLSSLLLLFVDEKKLISALPKNPLLGALFGSCAGFLFPVCECGNVPVARRLLMQGAPAPVAIGFLLAAPTINPIVIWSTWVAFREQPEIVFLRIGFSLAIATIIGFIFSTQKDMKPLLQASMTRGIFQPVESSPLNLSTTPSLLKSGSYLLGGSVIQRLDPSILSGSAPSPISKSSGKEKFRLFIENTVQELRELGGVLVLGSAMAAFLQVAVPREVIISLGQGPILSIVAMMVLAALVSICSTVDAFFALAFASTFTSGSLLAFLVFGPMVDLKALGLMLSVFKPRAIIYIFAIAAQLTFLFTLFMNLYIS
jgi:uncharacterized protein